jgi:hypothetical protein
MNHGDHSDHGVGDAGNFAKRQIFLPGASPAARYIWDTMFRG